MDVFKYKESDEPKILNLLKKYKIIPYSEYSTSNELPNIFFKKNIQKNEHDLWLLKDENECLALMNLRHSEWDSEHFGLKIGIIDFIISNSPEDARCLLHSLNNELSKYDLIMATLRTEDPLLSVLQNENFVIMSNSVTYSYDYKNPIPTFSKKNDTKIRPANKNDIKNITDIAIEGFGKLRIGKDHFHADSRLSEKKSDELYTKWVSSLAQNDKIVNFVAEVKNEVAGFSNGVIYDEAEKIQCVIGSWTLGAVSSKFYGRGIYTELFMHILKWFQDKANYFEISTQVENKIVQNVWIKNNLKLVRSECKLHRHFNS